jgi:uncharacterized protein (DUF2147 family)
MSACIASSTPTSPVARDPRRAIRPAVRGIGRAAILAGMLAALGAESTAMAAGPAFLGNWARGDGKTHIRVERCGADYCGVNTWVKPGHGEKVGDTLVVNVKQAGADRWSGTAFDRRRNRHYTMRVHVADGRMTTDGCVLGGLMCQSMSWTRLGRSR